MGAECCYLVGNLDISPGCVTSIQMQSSTEISKISNTIIQGPTIGTVNITGYASSDIFVGCPGRAGVSIEWVRKYDCDNDMIYLLFAGAGKSYSYGDASKFAKVTQSVTSYSMLNASAANGPTSLYDYGEQIDGYGLEYSGGPFSFSTEGEPFSLDLSTSVTGDFKLYLQNFSLQCSPGAVPVSNYSFVYLPAGGKVG